MIFYDNLPPGVTNSMLPGCSRKDKENSRRIEDYDNFDGWVQWLEDEQVGADFEEYCIEHFWNVLRKDFESQLHPDTLKETNDQDPLGDSWPLWSMYLFLVLDQKHFEVLLSSFVESNRDEFEGWVLQ